MRNGGGIVGTAWDGAVIEKFAVQIKPPLYAYDFATG